MTKLLDKIILQKRPEVESMINVIKSEMDNIIKVIEAEFALSESDTVVINLNRPEFKFLMKDKNIPLSIDHKLSRVLGTMIETQHGFKVKVDLGYFMDAGIKRAKNNIELSLPVDSVEFICKSIS